MFHLHGQAQPAEAVVVVRAFLKGYPESELREVGEMEGFVQRVQTVEHDENKSKEEWRVSFVIDVTPESSRFW